MIVICIYDESSPIYTLWIEDGEWVTYPTTPEAVSWYENDKTAWQNFIDSLQHATIRLGLLQPQGSTAGYDTLDVLRRADSAWPHDSDNNPINLQSIPFKPGRLVAEDIVDFFETVRTTPSVIEPQLLLFCLDNSGSINVSQYAAELAIAKAQLQATYPQLIILDDISNAGERWLNDARTGCIGRTCG
jgi:hypothetical protein